MGDPISELNQRRYAAARERSARLTVSQIDDKLNLLGCPHVLRDEIVERLMRLERFESDAQRHPDS